jgi:DeoR/GlpR family transcriptional regulator of sugar metabolism
MLYIEHYWEIFMNDRCRILVDKLKSEGHVSVVEQSKKLQVTEMTIRRDLRALEEMGVAIRVHGGAIPATPLPRGLDVITRIPRKDQILIAKRAVAMLAPDSTVMLNVGTTVFQVAREIAASNIPLTVITNSLPVAVALHQSECQVILTGGLLRNKALDLAGPLTEKNLDEYQVDILIAGCDGMDPEKGFYTSDANLAAIERHSAKIARKVAIVAESAKFATRAFAKFAEIEDVSTLITDDGISKSAHSLLEKCGVEVLLPQVIT